MRPQLLTHVARVADLDLTHPPPATLVAQGGGESGVYDACGTEWDCRVGPVASDTFSGFEVLYHSVPTELVHREVVDGEQATVLSQQHQEV